ncbi:MAG: septum formation family protein, partial [Acidimicrobiales bacterium]
RGLLAKRQSVVAPPQAPYEPPTTAEPVEASTNAAEFTQPSSGVPTKADGLTETAALADPRSEIPEPFPETVESNLLDPEERPSFLKRWWKAIAIMLAVIVAANALVWWVQRDDSGSQSSNGPDVFELDEGTCIDEPTLAEQAEVKGSVKTVSCLELHTHEVFHTVKHPAGDFDTVLIQRFAEAECVSRFETYTGTLYDRSVLNFVLLLPNEKAWEDADRRSTICALYDDSGPTTGSAKLAP